MKRFLTKIFLLAITVLATYLMLGFLGDGYTDPFYLRLTTPKQKSLVIGTSRAAQGIVPEILNKEIHSDKHEGFIYNFGFTVIHSPYGETYYKAIKAKLDETTKNGLFIVAVDPWSISSNPNKKFGETELELAKISCYNSYPNYDYLSNAYKNSMFHLIQNKFSYDDSMFLHDDGWLEVSVDVSPEILNKRSEAKLQSYKEQLPNNKISKERNQYLEKIIRLLKKHGTVVLIRIPIDDRMLKIENKLSPHFNQRMKDIADAYNLNYLICENENYIFTDANHLYKESGKKFTKNLSDAINRVLSEHKINE